LPVQRVSYTEHVCRDCGYTNACRSRTELHAVGQDFDRRYVRQRLPTSSSKLGTCAKQEVRREEDGSQFRHILQYWFALMRTGIRSLRRPHLIVLVVHHLLGDHKGGSAVQLVVGGAVLLAAYLAGALMLQVREIRELGGMVRGRLGR